MTTRSRAATAFSSSLLIGLPLLAAESSSQCSVKGAERYACVSQAEAEEQLILLRVGPREVQETIPGPLAWPLRLGSVRDVVLARGVRDGNSASEWWSWWTRLIGLNGTVLSTDDPVIVRLSETGDWLAMQAVQPIAVENDLRQEEVASSDRPLVVYRSDGREVRRVPGLRVFKHQPEDEDDDYAFSNDGRAIAVYRAENRNIDIYGLDGDAADETVFLSELAPGFSLLEFEFVDTDRIVMWQPEMFGRSDAEWLRVLERDASGHFTSRTIAHSTGYWDLREVSAQGRLLLSGSGGYDVVGFSGELVWRMNPVGVGRSDLAELMPERQLRTWQPRLLAGGDILLRKPDADLSGPSGERVVVHLSATDGVATSDRLAGERTVISGEEPPLARAVAIAKVPGGAVLDGSGRYALVDPALGPQRIEAMVVGVDRER